MGVEAMVRQIAAEAEEEAAGILLDADERAEVIVSAARDEAHRRVAEACERAAIGLRAEEVRTVNLARLRLLERRAEQSAHRTAAVFDAAAARLETIAEGGDPARWARALRRLAGEALALVGPGATVRIRARDAEALGDLVATAGARLETAWDAEPPPGLLARSADGRFDVDATLPARLERARVGLAEAVARCLAPEG